ncbi:MAG: RagB/SusD family nutrient uptake outer membrane protein, partial [Siphonobacter aquaeclarae]|nr:RagB/SusD family nutrient uptake outer membrane protein [Siphonobacter aquaeclarae]
MKANTFFLVLWTMGCLTSCRQFLEVRPTDFITAENYYNTEAELQTALNGVYDRLGDDKIYGSNLSYWLTVENDETYHNASNYGPVALYNYNASDPNVDSFWANLYYGIERANLLLANINKPREISESRRNSIHGEALFLRAYFYFLLVTHFGDVPLKLEPNSSVVNTAIARTPQQKVYEQIIADMTTAEGLLQNQTATSLGYGGKVTRTAVQGILARVCLSMAGYPLRDESKFKEA